MTAPDRIRAKAPNGVLTPKVQAFLQIHKAEIVNILCAEAENGDGPLSEVVLVILAARANDLPRYEGRDSNKAVLQLVELLQIGRRVYAAIGEYYLDKPHVMERLERLEAWAEWWSDQKAAANENRPLLAIG